MNDRALLPAHVPVPQELGNWKGAERHLVYLSQNREHRCLCDEMGWGRKERQTDREEKYNLKLCELPWEMLYVLFLEFSFCFLIFHRHPWEVLLYYPSTSHPWIPASPNHCIPASSPYLCIPASLSSICSCFLTVRLGLITCMCHLLHIAYWTPGFILRWLESHQLLWELTRRLPLTLWTLLPWWKQLTEIEDKQEADIDPALILLRFLVLLILVCVCVWMYICVCIYMYRMWLQAYACVFTCVYACMYMCVNMGMCMCVCMCLCV